ncbi:MAG TPA: glycoside hydrolase family 172 protein [Blastocatellia bacterium]|nr:glycoside hydrolase family 172 protein [Blastocatellia bacterium]
MTFVGAVETALMTALITARLAACLAIDAVIKNAKRVIGGMGAGKGIQDIRAITTGTFVFGAGAAAESRLHKMAIGIGIRALAIICLAGPAFAQSPLYVVPDNVETLWASPENPKGERGKAAQANSGRKGSPSFPLKAGEQRVLAESSGSSGTIRRIWITISDRSPKMLRGIRLDIYWDGARTPAVSSPIGDFFGLGLGQMVTFQSALFASPEGRSFNCFIPMPFRSGMKMTVTNETDRVLGAFYYDVDYTLGDRLGTDVMYFHAYFNRQNPTELQRDFEILPLVTGRGRFLGANIGVIADKSRYAGSWWGEGEVKVYLDGDRELPTLSGTGTEDYIGSGWGMGAFVNPYEGCEYADQARMRYGFYRYHIPDPVYFRRAVRVTIQQIGYKSASDAARIAKSGVPLYKAGMGRTELTESATGLFERQDDWSSCAYFYLDRPENNLPRLLPVNLRTAGL